MSRPVTLFTGQWADLPLAELAKKAAEWGLDGLELASWSDHFDAAAALVDVSYCREHTELLQASGLRCWAIDPAAFIDKFGDPDRGWDFVSPEWGARDTAAFVRRGDFPASQSSFDVAFAQEGHHG